MLIMKKQLHIALLVGVAVLLFASCSKSYDGMETWRIASTTTFEAALSDGLGHWMTEPVPYHDTYLYKKQYDDGSESSYWQAIASHNWSGRSFDEIYEEGFEYIVEVKCYHYHQTSVTYARFVRLLSKEKKDSDVSPETILIPWFPD